MDLLTIALLFGAGKLLKGKKTADRLEYFPKNLHYKDGKFYLYVDVLNPTKNPLKVDSFFGGVFIGTNKAGSIEAGTPVTFQANKRTEIKYPIIPVGSGFGKALIEIAKGNKPKFKIIGVARSLGIDTPINYDLTF